MRKIYLALVAMMAMSVSLSAQSKLDLGSHMFLRGEKASHSMLKSVSTGDKQSVIIKLNDGYTTEELSEAGIEFSTVVAGKYVVASLTRDQLRKIDSMASVKNVSVSRKFRLHNDQARLGVNIEKVHSGTGLSQAYKGDGVLVGIVDGGFDPNHAAFLDESLSKTRVERYMYMAVNKLSGKLSVSKDVTGDNISTITTDDSSDTHGTHTSAIMAGSATGTSTDYRGMAPNADIFMCAGDLSDAMILESVAKIKEQAQKDGKPAVINMSLGDSYGPHDGTDAFTAALNELAKDITICVSAGNEKADDIALRKTFTSTDNTLRTALMPFDSGYQAAGSFVFYGNDDSDFDLEFSIVNKNNGQVYTTIPMTANGISQPAYVSSGTKVENGDITDTYFTNYYPDSFFGAWKMLDTNNGRMCIMVQCEMYNKSSIVSVLPVITIKGKAGQTIRGYGDAYYSYFYNGSGFDAPTGDGTISNMACGPYTISVGSYSTKNIYPYTGNTLGDTSYFSSYGELVDGRVLPTICTPGCAIVSAMSYYFVKGSNYSSTYYPKTASISVNGKTHYYTPAQGTSMACPVATGVIATWLQANPNLTPSQIMEIAQETATVPVNMSNEWGGAGKMNAYAGLKKALELAGVTAVEADGNETVLINETGGKAFEIYAVDANGFNVALYNLAGQAVATAVAESDTANLDASNVPAGVYVVKASGKNVNYVQKIVIR